MESTVSAWCKHDWSALTVCPCGLLRVSLVQLCDILQCTSSFRRTFLVLATLHIINLSLMPWSRLFFCCKHPRVRALGRSSLCARGTCNGVHSNSCRTSDNELRVVLYTREACTRSLVDVRSPTSMLRLPTSTAVCFVASSLLALPARTLQRYPHFNGPPLSEPFLACLFSVRQPPCDSALLKISTCSSGGCT
jgi:hypothetical protein